MPTLYLMVGLPSSGKSTIAQELRLQKEDTVRLESDSIRKWMFEEPDYSGKESGMVFVEIQRQARIYAAQSWDIIIDSTNLTERDRRPFYDLAKHRFEKVLTIWVQTEHQTSLARLRNKTPENLSDATPEVYWRMYAKPVGQFPHGVLLVSGVEDVEKTVKKILETEKTWPMLLSSQK